MAVPRCSQGNGSTLEVLYGRMIVPRSSFQQSSFVVWFGTLYGCRGSMDCSRLLLKCVDGRSPAWIKCLSPSSRIRHLHRSLPLFEIIPLFRIGSSSSLIPHPSRAVASQYRSHSFRVSSPVGALVTRLLDFRIVWFKGSSMLGSTFEGECQKSALGRQTPPSLVVHLVSLLT